MIRILARSTIGTAARRGRAAPCNRSPDTVYQISVPVCASGSVGLLSNSRTLMMPIPPFVWKLISVGGVFLIDAFIRAHQQHVAKMAKEEADNGTGESATASPAPMAPREALAILGLPEGVEMPLNEMRQQEAKQRFNVLFLKAEKANSPYLQGKVSAAYRMLCDPNWDDEIVRRCSKVDGGNEETSSAKPGGGSS